MKKKLEAELISIAHRVLKLKGKEDLAQLHREAQLLHEQLSILKFYHTHVETLKEEIPQEEFESKLDQFNAAPVEELIKESPSTAAEVPEVQKVVAETPIEETVEDTFKEEFDMKEEIIEEEIVEEVHEETLAFTAAFELATEEMETPKEKVEAPKQISLEDFLHENYQEPEFIKVDEVPSEVKETLEITFEKKEEFAIEEEKITVISTETLTHKTESKPMSLNDTLIKGINVGLNDRIAFVKHLFNGSNEDYNRVLSQLNSFDTLEEAEEFVVDMVKPDYNNWEGKEDYALRFMNLVEKKFV